MTVVMTIVLAVIVVMMVAVVIVRSLEKLGQSCVGQSRPVVFHHLDSEVVQLTGETGSHLRQHILRGDQW